MVDKIKDTKSETVDLNKVDDAFLKDISVSDKEEEKILDRLRNDFSNSVTSDNDNIKEAKSDIAFYDSDQYSEDYKNLAKRYNKPTSVFNLLPPFIDQVVADTKQNAPFVSFKSADINTDKLNTNVAKALVARIQEQTSASKAYIKAFENAVICGRGGFRIYPEYEDGITFNQRIRIEAFEDPFDFYVDPTFENDLDNMKYAFVNSFITKSEYKKQYGEDIDDLSTSGFDFPDQEQWVTDERIRIVEYFYIEEESQTIHLLEDGLVVTQSQYEGMGKDKAEIKKTRKNKTKKVMWVKSNGFKILEKKQFPGTRIPIVPIFGNPYVKDGKRKYRGIVRNLKNAQTLHNFAMNSLIVMIAGMANGKYVATKEQLNGFEKQWKEMHLSAANYVLYNDKGSSGEKTAPPFAIKQDYNLSEIMSVVQSTLEEFKNISGIYDPSLGKENTGEKSGVALFRKQKQSLLNNFKYLDNLNDGLIYAGRILLDMLYLVVDEKTTVEVEDEVSGEVRNVSIMSDLCVDLMGSHLSVEIDVSNANETQREESKDVILSLLQVNPECFPLVADKLLTLVDTPVAQVLADRFKRQYNPSGSNDVMNDPTVVQAMQQLQIQSEEEKNQMLQENNSLSDQLAQQQSLIASLTAELNKSNNKLEIKEKSFTIELEKQVIEKEKEANNTLLKVVDSLLKNKVSIDDPNVRSILNRLTNQSFDTLERNDNIVLNNDNRDADELSDGVILPGINDDITKASGTTPADLLQDRMQEQYGSEDNQYSQSDDQSNDQTDSTQQPDVSGLDQQIDGAIPRSSLRNN